MKNIFALLSLTLILFCGCGQPADTNHAPVSKKDTIDMPAKIKLVSDSEPGEPMIISGTVYLPDGKTPAKNAILSVWHTDANGNYIKEGGGAGEDHPRIHGRMKTGPDGKYEFRTIRPGQYPSHTSPAHIHAHISAPDYPEYALAYYFEGDNLITDQNRSKLNGYRGGTPSIITLIKDSTGVWIGHRDIILEYVKPSDETMKLEW
ncbi:MAG TPA: protocatechuate 3,4-dioxygenase [Bacteroidia bacterium]|jgi:protocatechuate 3,4-dioxygenase beta subunit|nr:protocatechuate 3,4-dioxygenase [Bacteroidia bacterium]